MNPTTAVQSKVFEFHVYIVSSNVLMAIFGMDGLSGEKGGAPTPVYSYILLGSIATKTDPAAPVILTPPLVEKTTKSSLLTSTGPKTKGPVDVGPLFDKANCQRNESTDPVGPVHPVFSQTSVSFFIKVYILLHTNNIFPNKKTKCFFKNLYKPEKRMKSPIRVLYRFSFDEDKKEILEIEKLDVATTAPKSERFQWMIQNQDGDIISKLVFHSATPTTRTFEDNTFIDLEHLHLIYQNHIYALKIKQK
jgi:hypothetical protein